MLNYIENDVYESTMTKKTEIFKMLYGLAKIIK